MRHGSGCTGTCVYRGCGLGLAGGGPPVPGLCALPASQCPKELPPRFGVCALPDLPARSPKVAPWLDGGLSLTSDVRPVWLLAR